MLRVRRFWMGVAENIVVATTPYIFLGFPEAWAPCICPLPYLNCPCPHWVYRCGKMSKICVHGSGESFASWGSSTVVESSWPDEVEQQVLLQDNSTEALTKKTQQDSKWCSIQMCNLCGRIPNGAPSKCAIFAVPLHIKEGETNIMVLVSWFMSTDYYEYMLCTVLRYYVLLKYSLRSFFMWHCWFFLQLWPTLFN